MSKEIKDKPFDPFSDYKTTNGVWCKNKDYELFLSFSSDLWWKFHAEKYIFAEIRALQFAASLENWLLEHETSDFGIRLTCPLCTHAQPLVEYSNPLNIRRFVETHRRHKIEACRYIKGVKADA